MITVTRKGAACTHIISENPGMCGESVGVMFLKPYTQRRTAAYTSQR
jgi:hypothetical protein